MSRRTAAGIKSGAGSGTMDSSVKASQDKQAKLLEEDVGHFSMLRALHLADYITELNGFCGIMSILSSLTYALGPPGEHGAMWTALGFIPFGFFFDFLDGRVARWRRKSSLMGQELDSLADLLSFGAAPAVAAFALGLRSPLDTLGLAFFVLCGLTRLARFNVTAASIPKDASGKSRYFEGFPIPTSLGLVAGMATCLRSGAVLDRVPGGLVRVWGAAPSISNAAKRTGKVGVSGLAMGLGDWGLVHPIMFLFVVWGCLMVSRTLRVPKP